MTCHPERYYCVTVNSSPVMLSETKHLACPLTLNLAKGLQ
jgi:hypothetical protein